MSVFINGGRPYAATWPRVTRAVVTPSLVTPITVSEAKRYLKIDGDDEDGLIAGWIRTATRQVETDTGLALITQTLDFTFDRFPFLSVLDLPVSPVQSVTSVTYTTPAGVATVWASSNYLLRATQLGLAEDAVWPTDTRSFAPVVVRVVAGYTSAVLIPPDLLFLVQLQLLWLSARRPPLPDEWRYYEQQIANYRTVLVA